MTRLYLTVDSITRLPPQATMDAISVSTEGFVDQGLSDVLGDPASATNVKILETVGTAYDAESADLESRLSTTFAATDGTPRVMKPTDNTKSGVLDWEYKSTVGYLLHLRAGAGSGAASSAFGIGTDYGSGSAGVIALKNDGNGLQIGSHPSHTGKAFTLSSYGKDASPSETYLYSGALPLLVSHKLGAGYPDGVTTSGSATLTSATAAFTAGDVGATLTQTTSRGEGFGAIPSGATIAAYVNATTVTMSAASTITAAQVNMLVGSRPVPDSQRWASYYNSLNEEVISLSPGLCKLRSTVEFANSTSTTADSQFFNGGSHKFYSYNTTNYTAHEMKADAYSIKLKHYAAAGKGSESAPVTSLTATQSAGVAKMGFLGASAVVRQPVTGSRTDGTALASLLTAMANLGLITDSTTA